MFDGEFRGHVVLNPVLPGGQCGHCVLTCKGWSPGSYLWCSCVIHFFSTWMWGQHTPESNEPRPHLLQSLWFSLFHSICAVIFPCPALCLKGTVPGALHGPGTVFILGFHVMRSRWSVSKIKGKEVWSMTKVIMMGSQDPGDQIHISLCLFHSPSLPHCLTPLLVWIFLQCVFFF